MDNADSQRAAHGRGERFGAKRVAMLSSHSLGGWCLWILCGFAIAFLTWALYCGFSTSLNLALIAWFVVLAVMVRLLGRRPLRWYPYALFLGSFLFMAVVCLIQRENPPIEDQMRQVNAAMAFADGDGDAFRNGYFGFWPYNTTWAIVLAGVYALWPSITIARFFCCLLMAASCLFVYELLRKFLAQNICQVAATALALFPPFFLLPVSLYNMVPGLFFTLLALLLLTIERHRLNGWVKVALVGLVLAVGQVLRPDLLLAAVAFAVAIVIAGRWVLEPARALFRWLMAGEMLVVFFAVTQLVMMPVYSLIPPGAPSANWWKLVIGTSTENSGFWSFDVFREYYGVDAYEIFDAEDLSSFQAPSDEESLETVLENLSAPAVFLDLLIRKNNLLWWGNPSHVSMVWITYNQPNIYNSLGAYGNAVKLTLIVLTIVSAFGWCRDVAESRVGARSPGSWLVVFGFAFIVINAAAFQLIEVSAAYTYCLYVVMFFTAADGARRILDRWSEIRSAWANDGVDWSTTGRRRRGYGDGRHAERTPLGVTASRYGIDPIVPDPVEPGDASGSRNVR